ncbi:hypothetical protein BDV29DRAFT_166083, partial [Aspergillus leporis]
MLSVITSFNDPITSVFGVIFSVFTSVIDMLYGLLVAFINFFAGIPRMVLHMVKGISEALGGLGEFIAGNIIVIAIIAGGAYGYLEYQRRQGYPVKVGNKKL